MITEIFLPEKIGSYYLFTQHVVGLDIRSHTITASKVTLHGTQKTIQSIVQKEVSNSSPRDEILREVMQQMGSYNRLHVSLASRYTVFRTIQLPFIEHEKISRVVGFEVEPLLPFTTQEAVLDFIVTHISNNPEPSAHIMVAAVPKKYIAQELELLQEADLDPDALIVDAFALYGFFKEIPTYRDIAQPIALIDVDFDATRVLYIVNQQLISVRTLNQGISTLVKQLAQNYGISMQEAHERLVRFGIVQNNNQEKNKTAFNQFWQKIGLTLNSFIAQFNPQEQYHSFLLLGQGAQVEGLTNMITQTSHVPTSLLDADHIRETEHVTVKSTLSIHPTAVIATALALPNPTTDQFNLRKDAFKKEHQKLFARQFITATTFALLILGLIFGYYILQTGSLSREISNSEQEALEALREQFSSVTEDTEDLEEGIAAAENELKKEETKWFAFSNMARASMLQYLLELTNRIDKEGLGFVPEQVIIREGSITLKAHVNSFESLKQLERALRQSKLFKKVEGQNDPNFTMRIELKPLGGR